MFVRYVVVANGEVANMMLSMPESGTKLQSSEKSPVNPNNMPLNINTSDSVTCKKFYILFGT